MGSTNLDWRSFLHNDELNAVVPGTDFVRQMDAMVIRDHAASRAATPEQWAPPGVPALAGMAARRFEYWL